jgi:hypothetical protein
MTKIPGARAPKTARVPEPGNLDGREIGNLILRGIPPRESSQFFSSLEFMRLKLHQLLHEAGETIRSVYFLNSGMGSVLTVQPDGKSVEVGLIGKEGFVGLPVIFGFKTSGLRVITQADGTAYRLDVEVLRRILPRCPELERQLQRFSLMLGTIGALALDESGQDWWRSAALDPGISWPDAREPPGKRKRGSQRFAKSGPDPIHAGQRYHRESRQARNGRLRLLSSHPAAETNLGKRDQLAQARAGSALC